MFDGRALPTPQPTAAAVDTGQPVEPQSTDQATPIDQVDAPATSQRTKGDTPATPSPRQSQEPRRSTSADRQRPKAPGPPLPPPGTFIKGGVGLPVKAEQLQSLRPLAKGSSAVIMAGKLGGTAVAVKLAKSTKGTIGEDIEHETKLLEALALRRNVRTSDGEESQPADAGQQFIVTFLGTGKYRDQRRFLVFDLCTSTLEDLLDVAELPPRAPDGQRRSAPSPSSSWFGFGRNRVVMTLSRCFRISYELCLAIAWLHNRALPGCCVIHRDLKPANVGLTASGSVRLLDLGLARVVGRQDEQAPEQESASRVPEAAAQEPEPPRRSGLPLYSMTGYTGSLRYMAPEVARHRAYNETVDCYSLGLIMWETATLQRPFKGMQKYDFLQQVVDRHQRPLIDKRWPFAFVALLDQCWSRHIEQRPVANDVWPVLLELLVEERYHEATTKDEQFVVEGIETGASVGGMGRSVAAMLAGGRNRSSNARRGEEAIDAPHHEHMARDGSEAAAAPTTPVGAASGTAESPSLRPTAVAATEACAPPLPAEETPTAAPGAPLPSMEAPTAAPVDVTQAPLPPEEEAPSDVAQAPTAASGMAEVCRPDVEAPTAAPVDAAETPLPPAVPAETPAGTFLSSVLQGSPGRDQAGRLRDAP